MKKKLLLAVICIVSLVGMALAQSNADSIFVPLRQIGSLRPSGIEYDPNFDRFAMVDLQGELVLADAATYQTQRILYQRGAYNSYQFSHDGRYLALAIDRRVEVWDTQTGKMSASLAPDGVLQVQGPLYFTPDDSLLLMSTVVPAPQATRQSENDTDILPYLWDVVAARKEGRPTLPGGQEAHPFFDFRNGLVIGANRYIIAGLPQRLQVIDGAKNDLPVIGEIQSTRLERDPIHVWRSAIDDFLYIDPKFNNQIAQVDTRSGAIFNVPLEQDLNYANIASLKDLQISSIARIIGQEDSQRSNSLLSLLLGSAYGTWQSGQRTTVMLLDILQPLTTADDQTGLLIYDFNDELGRGVLELIHPDDVQQMVLSPDHAHLMLRRASGMQAIEVYNLDSGVLEKSYYPAEPDSNGSHILAYNAAGDVIISDFQRFDVRTGAVLQDAPNYTSGFDNYYFTDDSQKLVTIRGTQWQFWNIASGTISQEATVNLRGNIVRQSADASHFLTRFSSDAGEVMEIMDVRADQRTNMTVPNLPGRTIEDIIPSDDWQNYLVIYSASPESEHYPGNEIAVYNFTQGQILFIAGDDLPQPDGRQYGWLDNQTIFVSSSNPSGHTQPERVYGLNFDPSGVPYCLLQAYPEQAQSWQPIWENLALSLRSDDLDHLAQRLCAALPASADQVVAALTPTATFAYKAGATDVPVNIPGVPTCLTSSFRHESIDYAALWRDMTKGLTDQQIKDEEALLCEGLISSLNSIEPTPTVNPNQFNAPTETPLANAPSTTDRNSSQQIEVMAINIQTAQRSIGSYIPPHGQAQRSLSIITSLFQSTQHTQPNNPVLSPDGKLLATTDQNGFVVIYRLTKSYDELVADEADAAATRQAQVPRSIGLQPTLTPTFENAGGPRPTLTPTVTTTPPPRVEENAPQANNDKQAQEFCPAPKLYDLAAPPPDFAATGRLLVPPSDKQVHMTWVLQLENGHFYPDDTLPRCGFDENCTYSFDQQWVIQQANSIIVSHPDGSNASVLFRPEENAAWPTNIYWVNQHTLRYSYTGYLPDKFNHPVTLLRQFDPLSRLRTDPFQPPADVSVNGLPTTQLAAQPGGNETLLLVSTPYGQGAKYYIYDRLTGNSDYFARVDNGSLAFVWHPLGHYLYYSFPDQPDRWYLFDVQSRQHAVLGDTLPAQNGVWSRDGRYNIRWYNLSPDEIAQRQNAGERLPKINIWDSQTGENRVYCIPESGLTSYDGTPFVWSPDNRYVAFVVSLPMSGDTFPTPTTTPDIPLPTDTPVPLETQYQYQFPRTLVLDTQTGTVTVVSKEVSSIITWTDNGGAK